MATDIHDHVAGLLNQTLGDDSKSNRQRLYSAIRLLGKYRCLLIGNTVLKRCGATVQSGPFEGVALSPDVSEGCFVPKLLGCYEQELHSVIAGLPGRDLEAVVNVGCSEGYYAVGMARLLPGARVHAFDINPAARELCRSLAKRNGLEDRITIGGEFTRSDFASFADRRTLIVCDIEGAEEHLLDPEAAPELAKMHLLVEFHEDSKHGAADRILDRFVGTHGVERFAETARDYTQFPLLDGLEPLDKFLAVWEWRSSPTPWAFLTPRGA